MTIANRYLAQNTDLKSLAQTAAKMDPDNCGLTVACMLSLCEDEDIKQLMTVEQHKAYLTLCQAIESNDDGDDAADDQETATDEFIAAFSHN